MVRIHSCRLLSFTAGLRGLPARWAVCCLAIAWAVPVAGQSIVFQEGFNDEAAAGNFFADGRGQDPNGVDGPGMWEFNFLLDAIGLPAESPEKRAAILWGHDVFPDLWTDEALQVWDGVVNWAVDGEQGANIYFLPDAAAETSFFLLERLEDQGHTVGELAAGEDVPRNADLIINTGAGAPDPPAFFTDKDVPVVSFNAANHDDLLIAGIGAASAFFDPVDVTIVEANKDHPALGGLSGSIPWTNDAPIASLQGIGAKVPAGGTVLATYVDPDTMEELPALIVAEKGSQLLGAFNPQPEGTGYWVGGAVDEDFGGFMATADMPRVLEFGPIDVTGREDVKLSVALAGSDVDFEDSDFLRISVDPSNSGDFQVLAEFVGNANKALDDGTTELRPDQFTDVTYDIPADAASMVLRIEAFNTFPNEVVAIDNLRVTAGGVVLQAGDADMDLDFDQLDLVKVQQAAKYLSGQAATWGEGDWNGAPGGATGNPPLGNGLFDQIDIITALATDLYLKGKYAAIEGNGREGDGQTSVGYDANTGELWVDAPAGSDLTSISIESAEGIFVGDAAQNLGGNFDNDADDNIFKATFGTSFGSMSFGNVAQAGLTEEFLSGDLTVVGSLAGGGGLGAVDLIYVPVPEPSSILMLGLGLAGSLMARLRRRN